MSNAKISINKLGEYMTATPSRRKQIIEDQKKPKTFMVARYKDARDQIVKYIGEGMNDDSKILQISKELRIPNGGSEFIEQDRTLSAEAIERFLEISEDIDLDIGNLIAEKGDSFSSASIELGGINVTVRPDVILKDSSKNVIGCIKLHFSKSAPLNRQGAEYVATALRFYLENIENTDTNPSKCYVIDISTGQVFVAPKAYKRRLNDLFAACEEIDARWAKN